MREALYRLNLASEPAAGGADLLAYEKARKEAVMRGGGEAVPMAQDPRQSEMVRDNDKEKRLRDRFVKALDVGKATSSEDGKTWTLFAEGKAFAGTPDMELGEVEIERPEFETNLDTVKQLLGKAKVDPNEALLLMAKAKDKYGSVDAMKLKQIMRLASTIEQEPSIALPEKRR